MNRTPASGVAATHSHTHCARNVGSCSMYKKKLQNEVINAFLIPGHCCICLSALLSLYLHRLYLFATHRSFPSILMAVLCGLPSSPSADSIPFPVAIVLSIIVFIAAIIRLSGYFLPRSNQPLQLIVSIVSLLASGLLLGFVSSKNGKSNSPHLWMLKLK